MKDTEKQNKKDIIKKNLHNNKYDTPILNKVSREITKKEQEYGKEKSRTRWVKVMYVGKQTKFITKLLKNSNLKIYFKTKIL
jgi:ribosomal protein S4